MSEVRMARPLTRGAAEVVLIVVGVLIALFLDGWWSERQERQDERDALAQIHRDLVADSIEMARGMAAYGSYVEGGRWALEHLGADVPADSAATMLTRLSNIHLYQPQNAGYVSLRSSGRLPIIQNDSLRFGLIRYFESSQQERQQVAAWTQGILARVQESLELDVRSGRWLADGRPPPLELVRPWAQIPSDPRFPGRVAALAGGGETLAGYPGLGGTPLYRIYLDENADLRVQIEAELGQ